LEGARKEQLFPRIDSNTTPPPDHDREYDLNMSSPLVLLFAFESMESKPLEDVFKRSSKKPEFTNFHLVSHRQGANPCPIYSMVKHKMASFQDLNNRGKKNTLIITNKNNSLFRVLSYLKEKKSFGFDIEYISRTPDITATTSTGTPLPVVSSAGFSHRKINEVTLIKKLPSEVYIENTNNVQVLFPTADRLDPLLKLLQGLGEVTETDLVDLINCVDYDKLNDDEKKMFNKFYLKAREQLKCVDSPVMTSAAINNGSTRTVSSQTANGYMADALRKCLLYLYHKKDKLPDSMQFQLDPDSEVDMLKFLTALSHLFLSNEPNLQHEFLMAVLFKISPAGHLETTTGTASSWTSLTAIRWLLLQVVELVLKLQPGAYPELEKSPANFSVLNMANLVFYLTSATRNLYSGETKTEIIKSLVLATDGNDGQLPTLRIGEKVVTTSLFVATLKAATSAMVDQLGAVLGALNLKPLMRLLTNDKKVFSAILSSNFAATGGGATILFKKDGKVNHVLSIEEISVAIREAIAAFTPGDFHSFIGGYQAFQEG